jgi:NAD(P)-dependent dehydrogenase (short-subunit alcohol dehydrogenase family)
MGDAADVHALAAAVRARTKRIDVLIHSAGGLAPASARTREGVNPALANVSGMYFVSGSAKPDASSSLALDRGVQERIEEAAEAWAHATRQQLACETQARDAGDQRQPPHDRRFLEQAARG